MRRFQPASEKSNVAESPQRASIQGAGIMTPDGLPSLTSVDLAREFRGGKRLAILYAGAGFSDAAQRCI